LLLLLVSFTFIHCDSTRSPRPSGQIDTPAFFDRAFVMRFGRSVERVMRKADNSNGSETPTRVHVAELKWNSTQDILIISLWLLLACIAKLIFNRAENLTKIFPESSLLIALGLGIGMLLENSRVDKSRFTLDSHMFFLYLLPPIIFDAGYFMPNRAFFKNWDSILLFSVVGTLFNALAIGFSLYGLQQLFSFTRSFTTFEILLFSSLISAVDPVAVIAVFEEININDFIFVNVFGEALFNDGVTVVLYELFKQFMVLDEVLPIDFAAGTAAFFLVAIGGLIVGLLAAMFTAILTKYSDHAVILAPLFIFLVPYMGYLIAETLSLSPIIAIAVCGMVMKQYVKGNVSATAANSVKYFTKMLSSSSETVIFMFLGLSTVSTFQSGWDPLFIIATIIFCIVFRTIGVILQCLFLNKCRGKKFSMVDQFILCYGGLRGAIAFGLAHSIPSSVSAKDMFLTSTIAVIFFTVFLQGSTIRPLVNLLKVERKEISEPTMTETIYGKYLDYMISGVEDIIGQKGHASLVHDFERLNHKVINPILMREHAKTEHFDATKIVRAYAKIILRDAMETTTEGTIGRRTTMRKEDGDTSSIARKRGGRCSCETDQSDDSVDHNPRCPLSEANLEQLYAIFSKMFDEKLDQIKELKKIEESDDESDEICDDYMKQARRGSIMPVADDVAAARRETRLRQVRPSPLVHPIEEERARVNSRSKSTINPPTKFIHQ
ncbi:hypothetical protein PFISCL1PPCAC_14781, partial [Pristionchus fissidentatus]